MICVGVNLSCLVFIELHKHVNLHFSSILKRFCPYFLEYFFFKYFFCLHPVFLSSHYTVIGFLDIVPKAIKTIHFVFNFYSLTDMQFRQFLYLFFKSFYFEVPTKLLNSSSEFFTSVLCYSVMFPLFYIFHFLPHYIHINKILSAISNTLLIILSSLLLMGVLLVTDFLLHFGSHFLLFFLVSFDWMLDIMN